MSASEHSRPAPVRSVNEDDIAQLREVLRMPEFNYVDFSAQREMEDALSRWPLLRELAGADRGPGGTPA